MKKGKVIVIAASRHGEIGIVPKAIVRFLETIAAKYGDIVLKFDWEDIWTMAAPKGYLWKGNRYPTRFVTSLNVQMIAKEGLVRKSVVTSYIKRFKALCDIPSHFPKLKKFGNFNFVGYSGNYPQSWAIFHAPSGYLWRLNDSYTQCFTVGDEAKVRQLLKAGLIKA